MANRDSEGPFVTMATLCERVVPHANGQTDVIGVIQRVRSAEPSGVGFQPRMLECCSVVALCSGSSTATLHVRLEMVNPQGGAAVLWRDEVRFGGEERTRAIVSDLRVMLESPGLYWFDVFVRERRVTRFPLRVEPT